MNRPVSPREYREIYDLLDEFSPLKCDCGMLCDSACCKSDPGVEMGMYLLPGEDRIHDKRDSWLDWCLDDVEDYDFPDSWSGKVWFVNCKGPGYCKRNLRPIQCRTFPLTPHLTVEGELRMIVIDEGLMYSCPIIDKQMKLDERFVQAAYKAWSRLIQDKKIFDLVYYDSRAREEGLLE